MGRPRKPNLGELSRFVRRGLLIMDALLKALEQRGFAIEAGPSVAILEVAVRFGVFEQLETHREQPEEHDLDGDYIFGHSRCRRKRLPSGNLHVASS